MTYLSRILVTALATVPLTAIAEDGSFLSDGVPIHFIDAGEGPAVIYLHSFAGSAKMWENIGLMPLDGFRTIAFDARGHGTSGKPDGPDAYGAEIAEDILRLMNARGVEKAHIVGYSMGAETALKFTTEHPDKVLSLVVAGSGWSGEAQAQVYGFVSQVLSGADTFGDFMSAVTPPDAPALTAEQQRQALGQLQAHGIDFDQPTAPLAAVSGAMTGLIGLEESELAEISLPVLGLAGEADEERGAVERLGEVVPDFRFVMIPAADHLAAPTTEIFRKSVLGFLSR